MAIHACYDSKGSLRVVDTEAGATCTNKETALSWNQSGGQSGGSPILYDANGQIIGSLLDSSPYLANGNKLNVYSSTLNRMIAVTMDPNLQAVFGDSFNPAFQTTDCTGQAYMGYPSQYSAKTTVFSWVNNTSRVYATVSDNASPTNVGISSVLSDNGNGTFSCISQNGDVAQVLPFTTVSLPFSTPVALPFKL